MFKKIDYIIIKICNVTELERKKIKLLDANVNK